MKAVLAGNPGGGGRLGLFTGIVHSVDVLGCCNNILLAVSVIVMLVLVQVTIRFLSHSWAMPSNPCCSLGTI